MKRILTTAFLITSLPVMAQPQPVTPVGTWCQSNDYGVSCFQYLTYQADGTLLTQGQYTEMGMGFEGDATWSQQGNQACISETRIDTYKLGSGTWVGEAYIPARCDTVLTIDADHFRYRKPNGELEQLFRVDPDAPKQLELTAGGH
ncbi:hypothetical protein FCL40_13520 [Ferrimonas sediminicola]|uniref:Uncharacterized protein n=1 Tax=Ferrimonas sediminicola TaxID=2569538 RepID=A0A4U1BBX3_9GAMM|nr:hypothetical protein [Ferrimonas sediminicola]TKB48143.1 hypothetical protein FCL40_13520 [Ferrimonas sediminicola]